MSHVATVDVKIKDLDSLKAACKALGVEFVEGQQKYAWYGQWMNDYNANHAAVAQGFDPKSFGKCEHAIKVPGASYEIGVVRALDGDGYTLLYDNFGAGYGIEAALGKGLPKLRQQYAVQVETKTARKLGYRVQQAVGADGKIRLRCTR